MTYFTWFGINDAFVVNGSIEVRIEEYDSAAVKLRLSGGHVIRLEAGTAGTEIVPGLVVRFDELGKVPPMRPRIEFVGLEDVDVRRSSFNGVATRNPSRLP